MEKIGKKMTLVELWKYKREQKELVREIDCPLSNPMHVRFDSIIGLDVLDYDKGSYQVSRIYEYTRTANGKQFVFTDYDLFDRNSQATLRLRVNDGSVLLLTEYASDDLRNGGIYDVLKQTNIDKALHDDEADVEYQRIADLDHSWNASVRILVDDHNGKMTAANAIENKKIEYWDFSRQAVDEAGQTFEEFVFAEADWTDYRITLWKGREIAPEVINIV